jgi:valyl-tRNA synthetase
MLNMLDAGAKVAQTADGLIPDELIGMDRFDARRRVVELIDEAGLLDRVEDRMIPTPFGDRSGVVIEPWLTDQWYVDAATLAKPAIEAVRSGDIRVVPETWKKTWFNWLENIQPWCVSRQLWWGHRIPAWYDEDGKVFVAESEEGAQAQAGEGIALRRDPDVLDTWFSSALWPFATLGWPEKTEALRRHYPNDVLISGFDIIFFWDRPDGDDGLPVHGERPLEDALPPRPGPRRAGPEDVQVQGQHRRSARPDRRYGADALRFTLAAMESQGRDIKLDEKRVEGYRNFATKLWNAARFCQANGIGASRTIEPPAAALAVNRWIVGETVKTVQALDLALAELRYDESANTIYQFTWGTFCDWYLELIKGAIDAETREVAAWVLDQILVMLHPFMPFVTEELWSAMGERATPLILAKWPMPDARALDPEAGPEIDWLIRLVSGIRAARSELSVPPGAKLTLCVEDANAATQKRLDRNVAAIQRLARIETIGDGVPGGSAAQIVVDEATFFLPLEGVIDVAAEKARLAKAAEAAEKDRDSLAARLANPSFVERAKPEAVEKARADHDERASEAEKYRAALARLG